MITEEILLKAYKIRKTEQSLLELFSKGQIPGTIHTCTGQELTGLAVSASLDDADVVFSNHRCHGHYLSRYDDLRGLIGELLGKPSGVCKGYGGSQHIFREGFFSSGIQAGMAPVALGTALSLKRKNSAGIVVIYIGDGTLGQGLIYEVLNVASKQQCPILFVVEDNGYAQSTAQRETLAGTIQGRAGAFNIPYVHTSTLALDELLSACRDSVRAVRSGQGPVLLHIETYRLGPHSKGDDNRNPVEIESAKKRDLLNLFITNKGKNAAVQEKLKNIDREIENCIEAALSEQALPMLLDTNELATSRQIEMPGSSRQGNHAKEINRALHEVFKKTPNILFLGEDVRDPYGGAFKISKGLTEKFPDRVINMPISEATIVGTGLGLALRGNVAICEIMFGDFISIAFDQILNHVAKIPFMYQTNMSAPLLIRTPMGGGRGYGSTHSQSLEKYLFGIPNIDVYQLHGRVDVHGFYLNLIDNLKRPAIVFENKTLYGAAVSDELPAGYELQVLGHHGLMHRLIHKNKLSADITVVCFGGMSVKLEAVASSLIDDEVYLDIFMPVQISKIDIRLVIESVQKTGKLLLVEEGSSTGGLSSELVMLLAVQWPQYKSVVFPQVKIVSATDLPIPAARHLEDQVIPTVERIRSELLELFYE